MTVEPTARRTPASKSAAKSADQSPRLLKSKPRRADWAAGDAAKFFSYTEAWSRIKLASRQGFFLEAVAIEESIVSDRLLSYLEKTCGLELKDGTKGNLNQLIIRWQREADSRAADSDEGRALLATLHGRLNAWRDQRNQVVHGMVKSAAARGDDHIESFLVRAKAVAAQGEQIAREISRWVDKQKQPAQRAGLVVKGPSPTHSPAGDPHATPE